MTALPARSIITAVTYPITSESMKKAAPIPQTDPRAAYLAQKAEIDAAIMQVLDSGQYILGPVAERFENEFAGFLGLAHGIGCASGTDAIRLALRTSGIAAGDIGL